MMVCAKRSSISAAAAVLLLMLFTGAHRIPAHAAGTDDAKTWSHFAFKPGQFFKYTLTSQRGLSGWVSVAVAGGEGKALNITLAGSWMGDFSETAVLEPGMSAMDFVYSMEDFNIPNAMGSLLMADSEITGSPVCQEGFEKTAGDKSIKVRGTCEYAGIKGLTVNFQSKHFATGKIEKRVYCLKHDLPLPLYVQCPAANDTWTYELTEVKGL